MRPRPANVSVLSSSIWAQGSTLVSELKSPNLDSLFSPELQQRFDIVGIDHRGTTEGIACLQTSAELGQYWEANHPPARSPRSISCSLWNGDASRLRDIYDEQTGIPGQYFTGAYASRAIRCEDASWSQMLTSATYVKALAATSKSIAPRFGESSVFEVATQCFNFPVGPIEPPPYPGTVTGLPHALLVSGTRDPITPLTGAVRVSQQISGSRLLLREGDRHLSYVRSACVRQKVDRYLVDLALPSAGTVCPTD